MIAHLRPSKRWFAIPLGIVALLGTLAWIHSAPLPFPTPAQQELIVLTQPGALTYDDSDPENIGGLEHDLTELFARELGVGIRYVLASPEELPSLLRANNVHLAAAWLTPLNGIAKTVSPSFLDSHDVLAQHEASLPITVPAMLAGRTVHVIAGSRQAATAEQLKAKLADLKVVELSKTSAFELLEQVASRRIEYAIVDSADFGVALQVAPSVQASLEFGQPHPIVWAFPDNTNPELIARAEEFLRRIQSDPVFARLKDRYFGHIHRLDNDDIARFIELSRSQLPKLRPLFQTAQAATGIDWRLLAALAYQESQWDPLATSPTGVRGIMMLTEDTADHLGIKNRLDPGESILAGARYLEQLRQQIPMATPEPERTWLALAAYNIGPGHFRAALTIGRQMNADVTAWHEMKRVLPLLAKPQYYQRLKSGRARGGEAVTLVENVRSYYDILSRYETPYQRLVGAKPLTLASTGLNPGSGIGLRKTAPSLSVPAKAANIPEL